MIIELHLLHSFPASNLNRDDVGQPKSVMFGGALRGRISSQCLKRSARELFERHGLDTSETGLRTKRLLLHTARTLDGIDDEEQDPSEQTANVVREALRQLGFEFKDNDLTEYLLFVGRTAVDTLAGFCRDHWDGLEQAMRARSEAEKAKKGSTKKQAPVKVVSDKEAAAIGNDVLRADRAADIALFGRMIADNKAFNVEASSQVAHAFSTHAASTEFDYYTAVDDLKKDDEPGADMIGTVDFNAACYYRYANLDLNQLQKNLAGDGDLAQRATRAWLESFIRARPSGKQNSTAALTTPDTLVTVVREHGSWNLANAFLEPVTGETVMTTSTKHMLDHLARLRDFYGDEEIRAVTATSVSGDVPVLDDTEKVARMRDLVDRTVSAGWEAA